jgi:hypothetical protein
VTPGAALKAVMKKTEMTIKRSYKLRLKLKQGGKQKRKHKHKLLRRPSVIRRKKKLKRWRIFMIVFH